jgi:hypothetical protein
MAPHHFAKMYENKSNRHDCISDSAMFNEAVGALCGMLYSVVTLKAFFPPRPKTSDDISENKITMGENFSPYQAILPGDQDETPNSL